MADVLRLTAVDCHPPPRAPRSRQTRPDGRSWPDVLPLADGHFSPDGRTITVAGAAASFLLLQARGGAWRAHLARRMPALPVLTPRSHAGSPQPPLQTWRGSCTCTRPARPASCSPVRPMTNSSPQARPFAPVTSVIARPPCCPFLRLSHSSSGCWPPAPLAQTTARCCATCSTTLWMRRRSCRPTCPQVGGCCQRVAGAASGCCMRVAGVCGEAAVALCSAAHCSGAPNPAHLSYRTCSPGLSLQPRVHPLPLPRRPRGAV